MKYRKLRIAWSMAWGVVAVLLIVLWVRGYWRTDFLYWNIHDDETYLVSSQRGEIVIFRDFFKLSPGPRFRLLEQPQVEFARLLVYPVPGFHPVAPHAGPLAASIHAPIWPIRCLSVSMTVVGVLLLNNTRFSLRTLLIARTIVAVGLGLSVWAMR